jgi:hypothetical protein
MMKRLEAAEAKLRRGDVPIDDATWCPLMSLCVLCAQPALDPDDFCAHHIFGLGDDWATGNRIMCDFLHRGIVSPTPCELADPSIELLVGTLEMALSP